MKAGALVLVGCLTLGLSACSPNPNAAAGQARNHAALGVVSVTTPQPNAVVRSPLKVAGVAPNTWFFEAVFPAKLEDRSGQILAEAPARALTDWRVAGAVDFTVDFTFKVAAKTPAMIVLQRDSKGEHPSLTRVRIPIVLAPQATLSQP